MAYDDQIKCKGCGMSIPAPPEDADFSEQLCDRCEKKMRAENLEEENYWGEFEEFPLADWKYEVANDDTRLSYWAWVKNKIESE